MAVKISLNQRLLEFPGHATGWGSGVVTAGSWVPSPGPGTSCHRRRKKKKKLLTHTSKISGGKFGFNHGPRSQQCLSLVSAFLFGVVEN